MVAIIAKCQEVAPLTATNRKGLGTMNANQLEHTANLAEWKQRIMDCRTSGFPVKEWCRENQINPSTYYRWQREIPGRIRKLDFEGAEEQLASEALLPSPQHEFVEVPLVESTGTTMTHPNQVGFCPVAIIRIGQLELSLQVVLLQNLHLMSDE